MIVPAIFLASLASAYLAARLTRCEAFTLADLGGAIFSACISLAAARFLDLSGEGAIGLPLLLACGLAIGLASLRQRAPA